MTELLAGIVNGWQLQTSLELAATLLALSYTVLAIRHSLWCWPAAFVSTGLTLQIMMQSQLFTDALLQLYYAGMAIYGWLNWRKMTAQSHGVPQIVAEWGWQAHLKLILATSMVGLGMGYLMATYTQTDFAYLGSQISCFAIVSTWLVAKKVLSNWLYWVVIDAASIYMYLQKDLYFFSALFLIYTVIAAVGYLAWRSSYQLQQSKKSGIYVSG